MKKISDKKIVFRFIYAAIISLAVLAFFSALVTASNVKNLPSSRLHTTGLMSFSNDWNITDESNENAFSTDLSSLKVISAAPIKLSKTLPELTNYDSLFIDVNFVHIKVFVDGLCIYDYSEDTIDFSNQMTGHFICQVPLLEDMSGKLLSIQVYQPNKLVPTGISSVTIGPGSAYITDYLYSHIELIISLFLILITSFSLFVVYLWLKHKKSEFTYQMFFSLSMFLLLSALWIFTDSTLPQIFWGNSLVICLFSFFCFMAFPIPLFSFVNILCPDNHSTFTGIRFLLLVNIIFQSIFYAAGVFNLIQMLPATHFLITLSVIVLLVFLVRNYRKNESPYAKPLLLALVLLLLSGALSLVVFYFSPQTDNSRFLRYGYLIFIGIMVYISIRVMLTFVYDYTEHQILRDLAYNDILTKTESRLAFEDFIAELSGRTTPYPVGIYVFDLNNLKITNDTYGHKAGDIILLASASCIMKVFKGIGRVFRIGGDEFAVIILSHLEKPQELIDKLQEEVLFENQDCEYPFTISGGYAISSAICGNAIDILFKKADREMYKNKMEYKKQHSKKENC